MQKRTKWILAVSGILGMVALVTPLTVACGANKPLTPTKDHQVNNQGSAPQGVPPANNNNGVQPSSQPSTSGTQSAGTTTVINQTQFTELGSLVGQYLLFQTLGQNGWFQHLVEAGWNPLSVAKAFHQVVTNATNPYTAFPIGCVANPYQNWINVLDSGQSQINSYVASLLKTNTKEVVPFILYSLAWNPDYRSAVSRFPGTYFLAFQSTKWLMSSSALTQTIHGDLANFVKHGMDGLSAVQAQELVNKMQLNVVNENTFQVNGMSFYAQNALTNLTLLNGANWSLMNSWFNDPQPVANQGVFNGDGNAIISLPIQGLLNYFFNSAVNASVRIIANRDQMVMPSTKAYASLINYGKVAANNYQVEVFTSSNRPFMHYTPSDEEFQVTWSFTLYLLSTGGSSIQVISDAQMSQNFKISEELPIQDFPIWTPSTQDGNQPTKATTPSTTGTPKEIHE